ncbi:hypothetical protein ACTXT7_006821 [Hymenolepis weldensis]
MLDTANNANSRLLRLFKSSTFGLVNPYLYAQLATFQAHNEKCSQRFYHPSCSSDLMGEITFFNRILLEGFLLPAFASQPLRTSYRQSLGTVEAIRRTSASGKQEVLEKALV